MIFARTSRHPTVSSIIGAAFLLALTGGNPRHVQAQDGSSGRYEFSDAHFHLTNYVQEGTEIRKYVEIMGTTVARSALFGIPLADLVPCQYRRLCPHVLSADRCAALLLQLHRRLHCDGVP